jgi:hypothetical protein
MVVVRRMSCSTAIHGALTQIKLASGIWRSSTREIVKLIETNAGAAGDETRQHLVGQDYRWYGPGQREYLDSLPDL